jgi:hypothetical protein
VKKLRKMGKYEEKQTEEKPAPEIIQKEEEISEAPTLTVEKEETSQPYEVKEMPKVEPSKEAIPSFIEFGGLGRKEQSSANWKC